MKLLSWLAVVVAALACLAIAFGPPLTPEEIGTRPILNGLILRFGLPALAILFAGETLRRRRDGVEAAILQTIGLIACRPLRDARDPPLGEWRRHLHRRSSGPRRAERADARRARLLARPATDRAADEEQGLRSRPRSWPACSARRRSPSRTSSPPTRSSPAKASAPARVLNLLLPGYLLPALAAAWVAAAARPVRPRWYVLLIAALALILAFAYVSLMVRHAFQGEFLDAFGMTDAENWTYSAVWLAFGILLLAAGIFLRSTMVRAASGLVIAVVVFKVFLFDMAALTGALRAASFLGLGAVLIVIGRLYQRLLMRGRAAPSPTPPAVRG